MSAGRVAKKIALFELPPPPVAVATAFTGAKTGDSPSNANSITNNSALLHRKDAIKRKKQSTSPNSASSTSTYSLEEYDTANSPASSCYSSGGDSGSGSRNGQLHSFLLDDYLQQGSRNRNRNAIKQTNPANSASNSSASSSSVTDHEHEHDLELYQSSSIESDYSSNNSSNYYNQKANLANRIYNNDNNMNVDVDVPDCNSSTVTLTSSTTVTGTNQKKNWTSKTKQQGLIKDSLMNEGRSLSLKDCYQSFSLPIVPGHLQLVEFSEIRLDSPEVGADADTEDGDDEGEGRMRANAGIGPRNSEQYEMEPFYEELDNYSTGQVDAGQEDDGDARGDYNHSFLWSKGKPNVTKSLTLPAVAAACVPNRTTGTGKGNEVKSSTPTKTTATTASRGQGQRPFTNTATMTNTANANGEEESESVYAEPVYNEMNGYSASVGSGTSGSRSANGSGSAGGSVTSASYWTPTSSLYNQSRNTLTEANANANVNGHGHKSESIYKTLKNSLSHGHKKQSPLPDPPTPIPCPSSSYYDMSSAELPPIPSSGSATGKFSTIAKSAGKKLVKKLQHIRRLSRTGLEGFELPSSLSIFNGIGSSGAASASTTNSANANQQSYTHAHDGISMNSSGSGSASIISHNEPKHIRTRSLSIGNISCNGISTVPSAMTAGAPSSSSSTLYSAGSNLYSGIGPGPGGSCSGGMKRSVSRPNIPPPLPPPLPLPNPPMTASIAPKNQSQLPQDDEEDDDFDDSDFYDSDSELIRNFVAAVQPIYAMEEEPLYQYYTYGISLQPEDDYQPIIPKNLGLTLDMLVPRTGQRTLWCELPEVVSSGILTILSDKQKQLQEAIFEILTSEVSYLKSLDVLITLFYENDQLIQVLTENDRAALFGNITYVKDCAQTFLTEMLAKWERSWYIQEVGQVIHENANTRFGVYKDYCRNKPYQDKTLHRLRSTNDEFVNVVKSIEENPKCQLLQMDSFLMLPMQRITRLPLLVNAIIQRTQSPKEKCHCEDALKSLTNLVIECNEAARESQDAEETSAILEKIEFPKGMKPASFGQLLLKGDFMRNPFDHQGKAGVAKINWTFQKNKRVVYWLILFTNQLLVTKKKSVDKFEVLEMASPLDANIKPLPNLEGLSKDFQHYFMLHFDRKDTVYFLAARTQSEVERWRQKLDQLKNTKELKVEAIFPYAAKRQDELSFEVGEIIRVEQMQPDGWYYGTKMEQLSSNANGVSGWFPGNYCAECC